MLEGEAKVFAQIVGFINSRLMNHDYTSFLWNIGREEDFGLLFANFLTW